jgi:hypothetical protein
LVGRGRRGEVKDAARQLVPLVFVLFYLDVIGVGNYLTRSLSNKQCFVCTMSRAGRGGGRGGFGGRNTFGGANNPPPMGLTFADIQAISREQSALYPVRLHSGSCTFILTVLRIIVHSLSSLFRH